METKCGTWNARILCRSGSLKTVARELARYGLDLMGVPEVTWNSEEARNEQRIPFLWKGK